MMSKVMGTDTHGLMLNGKKKKKTQATDIAQYDSICLKNKTKKTPLFV